MTLVPPNTVYFGDNLSCPLGSCVSFTRTPPADILSILSSPINVNLSPLSGSSLNIEVVALEASLTKGFYSTMSWLEGLAISPTGLVCALGPLLAVTYFLALSTWRLYLCRQAEIPGPTLAKLTYW